MQIITDITSSGSGLVVTKQAMTSNLGGPLVATNSPIQVNLSAESISLGGSTKAAGEPPTDGSITTLIYKDTNTGFKYVNLGTVEAPDWDVL